MSKTKTTTTTTKTTTPTTITKQIHLIRHAESLGQKARVNGLSRDDDSLRDCAITKIGKGQVENFAKNCTTTPEVVIVSPLKRAIQTAMGCFPHCETFIIHPSLAEVGNGIPENQPRPLSQLSRDREIVQHAAWSRFDTTQLPTGWPTSNPPTLKQFLLWLDNLPQKFIAIVAHHNLSQQLIGVGKISGVPARNIAIEVKQTYNRIPNCVAIPCSVQTGKNGAFLMTDLEKQILEEASQSTSVKLNVGKNNKGKGQNQKKKKKKR